MLQLENIQLDVVLQNRDVRDELHQRIDQALEDWERERDCWSCFSRYCLLDVCRFLKHVMNILKYVNIRICQSMVRNIYMLRKRQKRSKSLATTVSRAMLRTLLDYLPDRA